MQHPVKAGWRDLPCMRQYSVNPCTVAADLRSCRHACSSCAIMPSADLRAADWATWLACSRSRILAAVMPYRQWSRSASKYGAPPEENTFFGAPLLIAVGSTGSGCGGGGSRVRALTVVALVFAVLSLGRTVVAGGHTVLRHRPMSVPDHLQLFDSVVPTRFGLALIPVVAVLLSFSVRAAATACHVRVRYGWAVVLVAALLPIAPTPVLAAHAASVPRVLHQRTVAPVRAR